MHIYENCDQDSVDIDSDCFILEELQEEEEQKKKAEALQKQKVAEQANANKQTLKPKGSVVLGKKDSRMSGSTPGGSNLRKPSITPKYLILPGVAHESAEDKIQDYAARQDFQFIKNRSMEIDQMEADLQKDPLGSQADLPDYTLQQSNVVLNTARSHPKDSKNILSTTDAKKSDLSLAQKK